MTILSTRLHSRELLVLGEFWCLDPLCIAAEGEELITLGAGSSMTNALGLFLSIMYLALTIQPRPVMFTFFVKC